METDLMDDAACAASDLTARLHAERSQAQAALAIADARALAALSVNDDVPMDVRNERILQREWLELLTSLLDGIPSIEDDRDRGGDGNGDGGYRAASA